MLKVTLKEILEKKIVNNEVFIQGWVRSVRKAKAFSFLVLSDGTVQSNLQVIVDQGIANYEEVSKLLMGSSVAIKGKLVPSQGKGQSVELQATAVEILGSVSPEYPLQKKGTSLEFLREIAHLRPRTNTFAAVFRIRNTLTMATHLFYQNRGFINVHTPIISTSDCEGAGELFRVTTLPIKEIAKGKKELNFAQDFFGKETYLTVSGQLEGECFATALHSIYTFGPTFRSENSNTARHLAEFWMIEPEVAFAELEDIALLAADYIKFMIGQVLDNNMSELEFLQEHYEKGLVEKLTHVRNSTFKKITYTEAVEILEKSGQKFDFPVKWGIDLQTEHERFLTEKHFNSPVIVTDYPKAIKAFYMRVNEDGKTVRAMDVLVPGVGEIIGGSQREERPDVLLERIQECGLKAEDYWWYLDLRKNGTVKHAGFGLGLERAVMYMTGMSNIRDVIPFPRTPGSAEF